MTIAQNPAYQPLSRSRATGASTRLVLAGTGREKTSHIVGRCQTTDQAFEPLVPFNRPSI